MSDHQVSEGSNLSIYNASNEARQTLKKKLQTTTANNILSEFNRITEQSGSTTNIQTNEEKD